MHRWFTRAGGPTTDVVVAAAALAAVLVAMSVARQTGWYPLHAEEYVWCAVLAAAAWAAHRPLPKTTLVVVGVVVMNPAWTFVEPEARMAPLIVAVYGAASMGATPWLVVPLALVASVENVFAEQVVEAWQYAAPSALLLPVQDPSRRILTGAVVLGVVALGYAVSGHRRVAEQLRRRNAELVALQEAERARVAAETRESLARDMHDVVAHHVSAMVVRAQAAHRVGGDDPSLMRNALRELAHDGSAALSAMRQVVRLMRDGGAGAIPTAPELDLEFEAAIARVRSTGRIVEVSGAVGGSADFVRAALLRIAQEALTNVLLHSDAGRVRVAFTSDGENVGVLVTDDGRPTAPVGAAGGGGGNGILGMRERAIAAGGTLTAGPAPEAGWQVAAVLPRTGALEIGDGR